MMNLKLMIIPEDMQQTYKPRSLEEIEVEPDIKPEAKLMFIDEIRDDMLEQTGVNEIDKIDEKTYVIKRNSYICKKRIQCILTKKWRNLWNIML